MTNALRSKFQRILFALIVVFGVYGSCIAEEASPAPLELVSPSQNLLKQESANQHRFFDRRNRILFAVSAGMATADFVVTRANLQNGGRELNPIVRPFASSTAGLAVNFAGQQIGSVGLSYWFHKTGHHRLERMVPMLNIGASAAAVTYGLTHR